MKDTLTITIITVLGGGLLTVLGSYFTARMTAGTAAKNYLAGGSQKDMGTAAGEFASAAAETAKANKELTAENKILRESLTESDKRIARLELEIGKLQQMEASLDSKYNADAGKIAELEKRVTEQEALIRELRAENAELRRRLNAPPDARLELLNG